MISGLAAKRIAYTRNGEPVSPPEWWPADIAFEHVSDVMLAQDIRTAYEAGRNHFMAHRKVLFLSNLQSILAKLP